MARDPLKYIEGLCAYQLASGFPGMRLDAYGWSSMGPPPWMGMKTIVLQAQENVTKLATRPETQETPEELRIVFPEPPEPQQPRLPR